MVENTIERCARAIAVQDGIDPFEIIEGAEGWTYYIPHASACVAALLPKDGEYSNAMIIAMREGSTDGNCGDPGEFTSTITAILEGRA